MPKTVSRIIRADVNDRIPPSIDMLHSIQGSSIAYNFNKVKPRNILKHLIHINIGTIFK